MKQSLLAVGLDSEEGLKKLDNNDARNEVRSKEAYWKKLGVTSVPTIVFNQRSAVTGAQPVDTFKQVLTDLMKEN